MLLKLCDYEFFCLTLQSGTFTIMNQKAKEKGADLVLDVVKYVITAGLLATLFGNITKWEWYWYALAVAVVFVTTWIALSFYKDDNKKKK
jgi:hypothetical protein